MLIIDNQYTCYGGDSFRTLHLAHGAEINNIQLCLTDGGNTFCLHLTSSDLGYRDWLNKHYRSLLCIDEKNWYHSPERTDGGKYHWEFHYILDRLATYPMYNLKKTGE